MFEDQLGNQYGWRGASEGQVAGDEVRGVMGQMVREGVVGCTLAFTLRWEGFEWRAVSI